MHRCIVSKCVSLVFAIFDLPVSSCEVKMQNSEKLCLKWNEFQENLNSAFGGFRNDQDFADVTLVCEDGEQIETHKVVLASSSPFFMEMLKKSKHPHPLIYMKGVKGDDLLAMVDFLYYGEANVNQENLDVFLSLAEELRLKGLTGSRAEPNTEALKTKASEQEKKFEIRNRVERTKSNVSTPLKEYNYIHETKEEHSSTALVSLETHQLDEQIKSMMTRTEKKMTSGNTNKAVFACDQCGKEGQWQNIKTHIEANHIASTISYSCDICGKISRSRHGLRLHKAKDHCKQILIQGQGQLA